MADQQNNDVTDAEAEKILEQINDEDGQQDGEQQGKDDSGDDQDQDEPAGRPKASRDAAKYRGRLREVEADRDRLTGQLETLQRQLIDGQIEKCGLTPALLWRTGLEPSEVLADDGTVDPGRVRQACDQIRNDFGLTRPIDPAQNVGDDVPEQSSRLFNSGTH